MARKKEERDNGKYKRITNKQKKYHEGNGKEDAEIIRSQLLPLGLQLREVPGDGNCLFRALGDQMDGHMGLHYRHRQETTNYMLENRGDFSPFVEDDIPFDKHISQLSQPGTYAGNDAIVAFARLHQVTVVIHQPNTPLWQIKGWEYADGSSTKKNKPKTGKSFNNLQTNSQHISQLHIAYHGGDHYDSIRRIGDTGHLPAAIHINIETNTNESAKVESYEHSSSNNSPETTYGSFNINEVDPENPEANEIEREAIQRSGCHDLIIVRQLIYNNCGNIDAAVEDLLALTISSEPSVVEKKAENPSNGRPRTFNRKQLEKIRKQERKLASEARKKQSSNPPTSQEIPDETIVVGKVQCLNI